MKTGLEERIEELRIQIEKIKKQLETQSTRQRLPSSVPPHPRREVRTMPVHRPWER